MLIFRVNSRNIRRKETIQRFREIPCSRGFRWPLSSEVLALSPPVFDAGRLYPAGKTGPIGNVPIPSFRPDLTGAYRAGEISTSSFFFPVGFFSFFTDPASRFYVPHLSEYTLFHDPREERNSLPLDDNRFQWHFGEPSSR